MAEKRIHIRQRYRAYRGSPEATDSTLGGGDWNDERGRRPHRRRQAPPTASRDPVRRQARDGKRSPRLGRRQCCNATHAITTPQLTGRSHSRRAPRTFSTPDSSRWDRNAASTRSRARTLKSRIGSDCGCLTTSSTNLPRSL